MSSTRYRATGLGVGDVVVEAMWLARSLARADIGTVWNQPYLETCCRAALHRLHLAGGLGRPTQVPDGACLRRLQDMALCTTREDGRVVLTAAGESRHAAEVLRDPAGSQLPAQATGDAV